MGSYKVIFKPSVEKDLRSLPQEVVKRILKLNQLNDFSPGCGKAKPPGEWWNRQSALFLWVRGKSNNFMPVPQKP